MDNKKTLILDIYKDQINDWYKIHNIIHEKAELYCDFLCSLLDVINETYLGSDVITSSEDMINHFNWCLNKVISDFEQEKIYFTSKEIYHDYLWVFFYKAYYTCDTEDKVTILFDYFKLLFNFIRVKTTPELESFTDLYKIFDQSLKKSN